MMIQSDADNRTLRARNTRQRQALSLHKVSRVDRAHTKCASVQNQTKQLVNATVDCKHANVQARLWRHVQEGTAQVICLLSLTASSHNALLSRGTTMLTHSSHDCTTGAEYMHQTFFTRAHSLVSTMTPP
jgi:hypothetical protein